MNQAAQASQSPRRSAHQNGRFALKHSKFDSPSMGRLTQSIVFFKTL
jgi:hypothetical protein